MNLLVFSHSFFYLSETFIYKQVTGMPGDVNITLLGFDIVNEDHFPVKWEKIQIKKRIHLIDRLVTGVLKKIFGVNIGLSVFNKFRIEKILRQYKIDLIHVHFGFNALLIYPIAKKLNIPLVVTFHGLDASPQMLKKEKYRKDINKVIEYAKSIVVVSPHMVDTLDISKYAGKTFLVPCSADPGEFVNPHPFNNDDSVIKILHSGRITSKKGVPDLVRVFVELTKKFNNIQLDIVGDGPDLALAKELAAGLVNIKFHGSRPQKDVLKFMADADIFVLNSRVGDEGDMEGTPVAIQEAMNMQLPVVATYHAGIPLLITDGENGLLVNERDNRALQVALEKLIVSRDLRHALGKAARETIATKFTVAEMNRKLADVYYNSLR